MVFSSALSLGAVAHLLDPRPSDRAPVPSGTPPTPSASSGGGPRRLPSCVGRLNCTLLCHRRDYTGAFPPPLPLCGFTVLAFTAGWAVSAVSKPHRGSPNPASRKVRGARGSRGEGDCMLTILIGSIPPKTGELW